MRAIRNSFSVVIPIYNSASYIDQTLKSIKNSSADFNVEVILVDDKSDDINIIKNILKKYSFAKVIEKKEKTNAAHSRNIGFENSNFEKVFFLDSDDCFTVEYIINRNKLMDTLEYGVYFGGYTTVINSKKMITYRPEYSNGDMRDYLFLNNGDFRTSTVSIDKKFHKGTLFDPLMKKHQDWGLGIRCYDAGEILYYDNSTYMIIHEGRSNQMSASMNIEASKYFINNYLTNNKHLLSFVEVHIIRAICNKDKKALRFFFGILDGMTLRGSKVIKFRMLKFGSKKYLIGLTSPMLVSLRYVKKLLK
ncbi:glycosyltransferase family 2 protein [Acerihabitans arboris]|uniref:Glycosyltransferase n=1 Tax=Acerihabitans arboris TaxID=2691583 RepID=A0A845SG26_9GAMM|nr:glycosyltransferase family 2 protein [Acerihabitans arboris]NDL62332.1 glycosyltransferase [Acerihabitans arboris]